MLLYKIFYSSSGRLLCKSLNTFFIFYLPDSSLFLIISKTSSFLSFLSLSKDSGCLFGFCLIHCSIIKFVPISNNLGKIFCHSLSLLAILSQAYPCGLINQKRISAFSFGVPPHQRSPRHSTDSTGISPSSTPGKARKSLLKSLPGKNLFLKDGKLSKQFSKSWHVNFSLPSYVILFLNAFTCRRHKG